MAKRPLKYDCKECKAFFARYSCNYPLECDCPRCQGYCECTTIDRWETYKDPLACEPANPYKRVEGYSVGRREV